MSQAKRYRILRNPRRCDVDALKERGASYESAGIGLGALIIWHGTRCQPITMRERLNAFEEARNG